MAEDAKLLPVRDATVIIDTIGSTTGKLIINPYRLRNDLKNRIAVIFWLAAEGRPRTAPPRDPRSAAAMRGRRAGLYSNRCGCRSRNAWRRM
jgi:hypothetical protein